MSKNSKKITRSQRENKGGYEPRISKEKREANRKSAKALTRAIVEVESVASPLDMQMYFGSAEKQLSSKQVLSLEAEFLYRDAHNEVSNGKKVSATPKGSKVHH